MLEWGAHTFMDNETAGYFRFNHKQEKRAVKYWEMAVRNRDLKSLTLTILDSIKKVAELAPSGGNLLLTLSKEKIQNLCSLRVSLKSSWVTKYSSPYCYLKEFFAF